MNEDQGSGEDTPDLTGANVRGAVDVTVSPEASDAIAQSPDEEEREEQLLTIAAEAGEAAAAAAEALGTGRIQLPLPPCDPGQQDGFSVGDRVFFEYEDGLYTGKVNKVYPATKRAAVWVDDSLFFGEHLYTTTMEHLSILSRPVPALFPDDPPCSFTCWRTVRTIIRRMIDSRALIPANTKLDPVHEFVQERFMQIKQGKQFQLYKNSPEALRFACFANCLRASSFRDSFDMRGDFRKWRLGEWLLLPN